MIKPIPLLISIFPARVKPWLYRRLLHWKIGKNVRVGLTYINGTQVVIGDDVKIGHFNLIMTFKVLEIGSQVLIKNFNHFVSSPRVSHWPCCLKIGSRAKIMSHHYMDGYGKIEIGENTTIGGRESQFWSHTLSLKGDKMVLTPLEIYIGKNVYVGARSVLLECVIPDNSVVGAGSVVTRAFQKEDARILIAGNPAQIKKRYTEPAALSEQAQL